ncbi:hypothetical protein G9A89_010420 [Geosiphon pyriformis]|nr:hypothetical protein G9A89_010420 [Geosiphon pyriformis]
MPFVNEKLTPRELKLIIDLERISKHRPDFSLILLASRILYRAQLKLYAQDRIQSDVLIKIFKDEIQHLPILLQRLDCEPIYSVSGLASLENKFSEFLLTSLTPLQSLRYLLTNNIESLGTSKSISAIRRCYKNLVKLLDSIFFADNELHNKVGEPSQRGNICEVNFAINDLLCSEGPNEKERIQAPTRFLWLRTLTDNDNVTHCETSSFALRRNEVVASTKYRNRMLRMNRVQKLYSKIPATQFSQLRRAKRNSAGPQQRYERPALPFKEKNNMSSVNQLRDNDAHIEPSNSLSPVQMNQYDLGMSTLPSFLQPDPFDNRHERSNYTLQEASKNCQKHNYSAYSPYLCQCIRSKSPLKSRKNLSDYSLFSVVKKH